MVVGVGGCAEVLALEETLEAAVVVFIILQFEVYNRHIHKELHLALAVGVHKLVELSLDGLERLHIVAQKIGKMSEHVELHVGAVVGVGHGIKPPQRAHAVFLPSAQVVYIIKCVYLVFGGSLLRQHALEAVAQLRCASGGSGGRNHSNHQRKACQYVFQFKIHRMRI